MSKKIVRNILGLSLLAALAGVATMAQAQQVMARVISAKPVEEAPGVTRYSVTYEYAGRQYTIHTDTRPGASIPIEVNNYGVTTSPVAPQPQLVPGGEQPQQAWNDVQPEPGVVVSGDQAPGYAQPAPAYYPAPVVVQPAYAYGYAPYPYIYPPIGLSLNLGYSRGWGGGWHGGRWR
ncbi:hypothetical protein [Variovorax sp. PBL-E5]|uniref:hypothetical protein n=1 Tax=Variovorax sp. PBL-E5 TaxID=434014 RepID=UPI0013196CBA|nr:hypothetical protein [Variovorax sp. PBL-E5]VTU33037.1 hypothetical protein E5CHR_03539 [Variovorax sp. PBL-E5]